MDARVIVPFRDREHMERTYYEGDAFSGTAERVRSLAERGYVEVVRGKPRKAARKADEEG